MWHGYLCIENLALSDTQRAELVTALQALGPGSHPSPACLIHWRVRPDNDAAIFEAQFDTDALTVDAFKNRLAAIFSVDPATIDAVLTSQTFHRLATPIVIFSHSGADYLRMALFGGLSATWRQSGAECRAYLALYSDLWGDTD